MLYRLGTPFPSHGEIINSPINFQNEPQGRALLGHQCNIQVLLLLCGAHVPCPVGLAFGVIALKKGMLLNISNTSGTGDLFVCLAR